MDKKSLPISTSVTLIGIGGIGTALLPVLARLDLQNVTLWDDDTVKLENLKNQLYWTREDVPKKKSLCAQEWLFRAGVIAQCVTSRYANEKLFDNVVIAAVDSMQSRRDIWNGVQKSRDRVKLFIDGRISRETPYFLQLFAISLNDTEACEAYSEWLLGEGESDTGRRDPDMISAPLVLSGFIAMTIVRWSRGDRLPWQTVWYGESMMLTSLLTT